MILKVYKTHMYKYNGYKIEELKKISEPNKEKPTDTYLFCKFWKYNRYHISLLTPWSIQISKTEMSVYKGEPSLIM